MTAPDPLAALRNLLLGALAPNPAAPLSDYDRALVWMFITTHDAAGGMDALTGAALAFADAVVVVAGMSQSVLLHRDTWATRSTEVLQTRTGYPMLSVVDGAELAARLIA